MKNTNSNIVGLLLGSLIGQGSFFISSTYLIRNHLAAEQAQIALTLSFSSLILWLTDYSTSQIIAQRIATTGSSGLILFKNTLKIRLIASIAFIPIIIVTNYLIMPWINMLYLGALVIQSLVWAFNLTGLYDAFKRNSLSGPFGSLNWLFASIAVIILSKNNNIRNQANLISAIFAAGTLATVLLQWLVFPFSHIKLSKDEMSGSSISLKEATLLSLGSITAQIFPRIILAGTYHLVSAQAAGLLSYLKSTLNAVGFIISIIRRNDIVELSKETKNSFPTKNKILLKIQWKSLSAGTIGYLFCFATVVLLGRISTNDVFITALLHIAALIWLYASAINQFFIASGEFRIYSNIIILSIAINLAVTAVSIPFIGLPAVALGEFAMCAYQIIAANHRKNRTSKKMSTGAMPPQQS